MNELLFLTIVEDFKQNNSSFYKLSKKYKVNYGTLCRKFSKLGLNSKYKNWGNRYTLDENYFDTIDSEEKAYFLGFLYADGCNYKNRLITLSLKSEDKHILEEFNSQLKSDRLLKLIDNSRGYGNGKLVRLDIVNKHMATQLSKLGCHPKKTYNLSFPTKNQVPEYLLKHFIRGYLDGDGTLSYYSDRGRPSKQLIVAFSSNVDFNTGLMKYLINELAIELTMSARKGKTEGFRVLRVCKRTDSVKLLCWLYYGSKVHLIRKYNKYLNIIEDRGINPISCLKGV